MKALLSLDFYPEIGGIQRYLYTIVRLTYAVDDFLLIGSPVASAIYQELPVQFFRTTWPLSRLNKKLSLMPMLMRAMRLRLRHPALVFECGNIYTALIPWLLRCLLPTPYAVYTYGTELIALRTRPVYRWLFVRVLKRARTIYALGEYTRSILESLSIHQHITIEPPRVIIDKTVTAQSIRKSIIDQSSQPAALLSIGRLVEHKGHAVLIDALHSLKECCQWELTIVGNGPCFSALQQQIKQYDLSDRITILRNADDAAVEVELKRATMIIHPALENARGTEGFGIVLLEAMARGVPIIASNCGGIPEVLQHGRCGILVAPDNSRALATEISALINDTNARLRLALAGLEQVRQHYSWNVNR